MCNRCCLLCTIWFNRICTIECSRCLRIYIVVCINASTGDISKFIHLITHPYFSDLAYRWQPVDVSSGDMKQVRAIGLNFWFHVSYFSCFYEDLTRLFSTSTQGMSPKGCRRERIIERIYSTADGD